MTSPTPATAPLTTPLLLVHTSSLTLAGTASPDVTAVTWNNSMTGQSGTAVGTVSWTAALPLTLGSNLIQINATAPSGSARYWLEVVFHTGPILRILSPLFTSWPMPVSSVTVQGIASSPSGIVEVTWGTSSSEFGAADGTTTWSAVIPLHQETTHISITAKDSGWHLAYGSFTFTYASDPPSSGGSDPYWYLP